MARSGRSARLPKASLKLPLLATAAAPVADPGTGVGAPVGGSVKRTFDVVVAGGALLCAAPVILALGCAIRLQDGGPMFYGHTRLGFGRRPFRCLKLRTMAPDGDAILARHLAADAGARAEWAETRKLRDDPRTTRIGRFLRRTSLDELPQLINIVRGDMSIVGPRPVTEASSSPTATRAGTTARRAPA